MFRPLSLMLILTLGVLYPVDAQDNETAATARTILMDSRWVLLEEVTTSSNVYYGQLVTVEGFLREWVDERTFVLHEGVGIDDDAILVVNNASQTNLDEDLVHHRLRISGRLHPSRRAVRNGAPTAFEPLQLPHESDMTDNLERRNLVEAAHAGYFASQYDYYTILEILIIDNLSTVEDE